MQGEKREIKDSKNKDEIYNSKIIKSILVCTHRKIPEKKEGRHVSAKERESSESPSVFAKGSTQA